MPHSVLNLLLDELVTQLQEACVFDEDLVVDEQAIGEIVETIPAMVTIHSFRTKKFFVFLNRKKRDFYGFEKRNMTHLNSLFYAKTFHPRTLHKIAHIYQFFYRGTDQPLHVTYRLRNQSGAYEKVEGVSKGVAWNTKGTLCYTASITCRAEELNFLSAIVTLGLRKLGERQQECLRWLLEGKTNAQIGDQMGISPRTVEKHIAQIFEAAGVSGRGGLLEKVATGSTSISDD